MTPPHPSPTETAARLELDTLAAQPSLDAADLARLPVLAAALGVAVHGERWAWGADLVGVCERWVVGVVRES